eukprot:740173-Pyramimonas_sp.AAC.1
MELRPVLDPVELVVHLLEQAKTMSLDGQSALRGLRSTELRVDIGPRGRQLHIPPALELPGQRVEHAREDVRRLEWWWAARASSAATLVALLQHLLAKGVPVGGAVAIDALVANVTVQTWVELQEALQHARRDLCRSHAREVRGDDGLGKRMREEGRRGE